MAVIVSQALPEQIRAFGERDGVWVCAWPAAVPVAPMVRAWLTDAQTASLAAQGADTKGQRLYACLVSPEVRNRLEGYPSLRNQIDGEKRAFLAMWKKRERQLDRALASLMGFHGDVAAIAGAQFEELPSLTLLALGDGEETGGEPGEDGPDAPEAAPGSGGPPVAADRGLVELSSRSSHRRGDHREPSAAEEPRRRGAGAARSVSPADDEAAKAVLLQEGRIHRGKGQEGSVARSAPA